MKKFSKNQLCKSNCLDYVVSNLHEHGESLYELMRGIDINAICPTAVEPLQKALLELRKAEIILIERKQF